MIPVSLTNQLRKLSEHCFLGGIFVLPFTKAGFEILFVAAFSFWIAEKILTGGSFSVDRKFFILVGLFIVTSSISGFSSGYPEISFRGVIKLIKYSCLMFMVADLFVHAGSLKWLFVIELSSFGLVILDALIQKIFGHNLITNHPIFYSNTQIRLTGPYQSYGLLAAHIIMMAPILFMTATSQLKRGRFLRCLGLVTLLLAALYVLYQTQSRGSWLAAIGSILIYGILSRNKWLLVVLVFAMLVASFILPKRILFHADLYNQEASLVERKLLWARAISVIKARPWFGCGIGTYTKNYSKYTQGKEWLEIKEKALRGKYANFPENETWRIPGHPDQIPNHYVHNGYLQMAAETGLISLLLFFAIVVITLINGYQAFKQSEKKYQLIVGALIAGLSALLLQVFVDTTLHNLQSAVFIWFFFGLLIAVKNVRAFSLTANCSDKKLECKNIMIQN